MQDMQRHPKLRAATLVVGSAAVASRGLANLVDVLHASDEVGP